MSLQLSSPAFEQNEKIPSVYTCDDRNISPPLEWSQVPGETRSFAIIFDDPDAPSKTWVHWLLYNIPGDWTGLEAQVEEDEEIAGGALHGVNDFGNYGYGGPCPPGGTHRYHMKLYALDTLLEIDPGVMKKELLQAMEGHVIEQAELVGRYSRS
ncbi:YbhB/YbcL family Raf kinase inhibitor-like protein [Fodinibius sediminis]|uniref:Phospholipid-binding protein, PBP family n=1 Tax=Fodinibius sediminis TaxID=1214077 RepID=A0A521BPI9_9BACT|nr:YbhB/YbcL family Raf kinase inhibitor-like protein [Fodinibius sediminis]SMO49053.1 phospholipid-binding protein, PBP family [Fodinibius sediminis]